MAFETPIFIKENFVIPIFKPAFTQSLSDAVAAYTDFISTRLDELSAEDKQLVQDTIELSREIISISEEKSAELAEKRTANPASPPTIIAASEMKPFISVENLSKITSCAENFKRLTARFKPFERKNAKTISEALSAVIECNNLLYCTSEISKPDVPGAEYQKPSEKERLFYSLFAMCRTFITTWLFLYIFSGRYLVAGIEELAIPIIGAIFAVIFHGITFVLRCNRLEKLEEIKKALYDIEHKE